MRNALWRAFANQRIILVSAELSQDADAEAQLLSAVQEEAEVPIAQAFCPEQSEVAGFLKLKMPFFSAEQIGAAVEHGPIDLDTIVLVCREIGRRLEKLEKPSLLAIRCSNRPGPLANCALLLGAYLVLETQVPADFVCRRLCTQLEGQPACRVPWPRITFPTPFSASSKTNKESLNLHDCLSGLEAAQTHGWLRYSDVVIEDRCRLSRYYDALPVFAVQLPQPAGDRPPVIVNFWISADPVTTVVDPSKEDLPMTTALSPLNRDASKATCSSSPDASSAGLDNVLRSESDLWLGSQQPRVVSSCSFDADMAVSAPPVRSLSRRMSSLFPRPAPPMKGGSLEAQRPRDLAEFAAWMHDNLQCKLMVRCNGITERGLPGGKSYSADYFPRCGVPHIDAPFADGTPPPEALVDRLVADVVQRLQDLKEEIESSDTENTEYSIVVHCKSGLGRSMCVLAALAVSLLPGLTSSAFFGWARLVRPGSVQTFGQELFLRGLDRKDDDVCCCWAPSRSRKKQLE